ncbi:ethanolamine ammonia-lyase subunit EutC [Alkalihalobacillus sp. BA299]|uniref:ethanolamine ammonia-lyase subunit EutC n=1 Tax=Alkalihalobacillus sp. BA299 TaxID=2815938 RepID=UPI001ADC0CDF|nr:ethanolamine ammonia-lyase subunit EutC [Alkalihalobacillus sp. BA299]
MKSDLIETITKLVIEKMQIQDGAHQPSKPEIQSTSVTIWDHTSNSTERKTLPSTTFHKSEILEGTESEGLIQLKPYLTEGSDSRVISRTDEDIPETVNEQVHGIEQPKNPEELKELMDKTPARIGIGRAGLRPKTNAWLKFRYDHAAAVDAVYGTVNDEVLNRINLFKVETMVDDKEIYIRRPDFGRKLSDEAKTTIKEKCKEKPIVQIIVSDGLSSNAVEENVEDVFLSLQQSLYSLGIEIGTPFYIEKGRVAVMDDVGEILQPQVVVLLIGERPGLVSAESLSAYLCYQPRKGTIEAERMVVSNIHKGGIPPVEAGAYIGSVIQKILKYEASGVTLVQKES